MVGTRVRVVAAVAMVVSMGTGCKSDDPIGDTARQIGDNLAHTAGAPLRAQVTEVGRFEGQTIANIATDRFEMKAVLSQSPGCDSVMAEAVERVNFRNVGNFGRLSTPNATCMLVGTLDLEAWWGQRQAPRSRGMNPRATAQYRVIGRDDDWTFLRGRFPLLGTVGIPGGIDMITAVPHTELCELLQDRSVVQMEFRRRGGPPVVFMARGREECPCEGVIQPQGPR